MDGGAKLMNFIINSFLQSTFHKITSRPTIREERAYNLQCYRSRLPPSRSHSLAGTTNRTDILHPPVGKLLAGLLYREIDRLD